MAPKLALITFICLIGAYSALGALEATQQTHLNEWRNQIAWIPSAPVSWSNPDACTWAGITCSGAGTQNVQQILIAPLNAGGQGTDVLITGSFPPIANWLPDFPSLIRIDFVNIRLGPYLPSEMAPYLAPGGSNGLQIYINGTNSVVVCPFPFEYTPIDGSDLWCSNENVVSRAPDHGPKEGGTLVHVGLNGFAGYHDIGCSFGYFEEGDSSYLVPVVPGSVNISDYYWRSTDYNPPDILLVPKKVRTQVDCISPAHPPGPVQLHLYGGVSGPSPVRITTDYIVFNYECPAGTFDPLDGTDRCLQCPVGTYSGIAATSCTECPEGTYNDEEGAAQCISCPMGTASNATRAVNATTCQLCPLGSYANAKLGATECIPCGPGKYNTEIGMFVCLSCTPGTYADGQYNTNCTKCPAGSFNPFDGAGSCLYCAIGSYNNVTGQTACTQCPPGQTTQARGSTSCDSTCPAGTYRPSGVSRCLECAPGRFGATDGLALCSLCPVNTYATGTSSTECLPCPEGTLTINAGQSACIRIVRVESPAQRNGIIIGLVFLVIAVIIICITVVYIAYKKRKQKKMKEDIARIQDEIAQLEKSKMATGAGSGAAAAGAGAATGAAKKKKKKTKARKAKKPEPDDEMEMSEKLANSLDSTEG